MKKRMMSLLLIMSTLLTMLSSTISAADYTVTASSNLTIPNLLIQDVVTGETSRLLDDYYGKYRVVIFGTRDCPFTPLIAMPNADEIVRQYERIGALGGEKVSVFVLDISNTYTAADWADVAIGKPNVTVSVDPDGARGYSNAASSLLYLLGLGGVLSMPAIFITDENGVVLHRSVSGVAADRTVYNTGSLNELQTWLASTGGQDVFPVSRPQQAVTLTPQNPSAVVTTLGKAGRVPITVTAPADGGVVVLESCDAASGKDPALYSENNVRIANDEAGNGNFRYFVGSGQTMTVYAGTAENNFAATYTVKATFTKETSRESIVLSRRNPTADIFVAAGIGGRVAIQVTAPANGNVTLQSSNFKFTKGYFPTLYDGPDASATVLANGNAPGDRSNWVYTVKAGQTATLYAGGSLDIVEMTYTITTTFPKDDITKPTDATVKMNRTRNKKSIMETALTLSHTGFSRDQETRYKVAPSFSPPYSAGALNDGDLASALNTVKMVRYLAGLPYEDVVFSDELNNIAQHGAVLLAASDQYTHTPIKPADVPQDFFDLGYKGSNEANIGMGYQNISNAVLRGWTADGGENNIERAGHRRWILRPDGLAFGIGFAKKGTNSPRSNMYVFPNGGANREADTYVAWPSSGDFPIQYFTAEQNMNTTPRYPWSINLGYNYLAPNRNDVVLTLTRKRDGKVWNFNQNTPQLGEGNMPDDSMHLAVDNEGYGIKKAIVFRPDVTSLGAIRDGDVFHVHLSGIQTRAGKATTLEYDINFFDLDKALKAYTAKSITGFAINGVQGNIDEAAGKITVQMPNGTDLTSLTPTITHTGESIHPIGAQDFTNAVKYTVMAQDGSRKTYEVNITTTSNESKSITDFALSVGVKAISGDQGVINESEGKITLGLPVGTSLKSLTPTITHTGSRISPTGAQDFTKPVTYTVTAKNGTTKKYTVTISTGYAVKFNSNGGSAVSRVHVSAGAKVSKPQDPTRSGYLFDGWYSDYTLQNKYNFNSLVNNDLTVHAKWIPLGNHVSVDIVDGRVTGHFNVLNTGGKVLRYQAMLAIYDNDKLLQIILQTGTLAQNGNTSFQLSESLPKGHRAKAFLWDADTCEPLY